MRVNITIDDIGPADFAAFFKFAAAFNSQFPEFATVSPPPVSVAKTETAAPLNPVEASPAPGAAVSKNPETATTDDSEEGAEDASESTLASVASVVAPEDTKPRTRRGRKPGTRKLADSIADAPKVETAQPALPIDPPAETPAAKEAPALEPKTVDETELQMLLSEGLCRTGEEFMLSLMRKHGMKRGREGIDKPAFVAELKRALGV